MSDPDLGLGPNYCRAVLINASLMLWIDICNYEQSVPVCHPDHFVPNDDVRGNLLRYCHAILLHHKHTKPGDLYDLCEVIQGICGLDLQYRTTKILPLGLDFKENLQPYLKNLHPTYRRNMPYVTFPDAPFHSS